MIDIQPVFERLLDWGILPGGSGTGLPRRRQMYNIARCFDIGISGAHNALADAFITGQVFQRCVSVLGGAGIRSAEGILKISSNFKGGEKQHVSGGICIVLAEGLHDRSQINYQEVCNEQ